MLDLSSYVSRQLLQHVEKSFEVDDGAVGARLQSFLESVAPESEAVDHIVRVDDADYFVRRQVAVSIAVFRSERRAHFTVSQKKKHRESVVR